MPSLEIVLCQRRSKIFSLHLAVVVGCIPDFSAPDFDFRHGPHSNQVFFDSRIGLKFLRNDYSALLVKFTFAGVGAEVSDKSSYLRIGLRKTGDFFPSACPSLRWCKCTDMCPDLWSEYILHQVPLSAWKARSCGSSRLLSCWMYP